MPSGGISEVSVNAVLAFIEAAEPRNEIEAALAIQMACTHAVAMAVLSRAGGAYGGDRHVALMASAAARLLNAFTAQIETMRRLRNGGTQIIRIERVEVSDGGQAVIGNVKATSPARDGENQQCGGGSGIAIIVCGRGWPINGAQGYYGSLARICLGDQTSRSSAVVRITGMAFGWLGSTNCVG
jgi:hypothetical protein